MTVEMYATVGAPGSGKSTYVKGLVESLRGVGTPIYVVSFDDARTTSGLPANCAEDDRVRINAAMDAYGETLLRSGASIVFDETHARPGRLLKHAIMAAQLNARLIIMDLTTVPIDKCRRNVRRRAAWGGRDVPEDKIAELHASCISELGIFMRAAADVRGLDWELQ